MLTKNAIVFAGTLLALGLAIAVVSLVRGEPQYRLTYTVTTGADRLVEPRELASWIIEGRRDFTVVDMRSSDAFQKGAVRGAVHCGECHESRARGVEAQQGESFVDLSKKLVLYTDTDAEPVIVPKILRDNPRLMRLAGGYAAWQREVMSEVSFEGLATPEAVEAAKQRDVVRRFFRGETTTELPTAKLPLTPVQRRGAHKAGAPSEGC